MPTEEACKIVNSFLKREIISSLQELIFCQSWQGKTYREIADSSGYTEEYIRDNGAKLWQQLSQELAQKVTKQNFKRVFEEYHKQKNLKQHRDWEEAIDVSIFCGRSKELTTLKQWIVKENCRLVGIFGIGGIGKTSLTVKLAQQIASEFDFVIWRSLRNATPLNKLLANIIQLLSHQQEIEQNLPEDIGERISKLITYLKSHRCLLILDNGETILQSGITCGRYRIGYEDYRELFQRLGKIPHQSCVVLTSREKPQEFTILEGKNTPVRSLQIKGLEPEIGKEICQIKGEFYGSQQDWQTLTYNYSGNPLAFQIVASTIKDLFDGNVRQFLQQEILAFDDIEDLLQEQLERLSNLEREIMYWLAIEREAISLEQLQQNLLIAISPKKLLEAIKSLKRRSLIEKTVTGFTQQPVVMEYLVEQQVERVAQEIADLNPDLLTTHALIKAQTEEYIRQIQTRVTLQPLANKLLEKYEDLQEIEIKLKQIVAELKKKSQAEVGYAVGNIINLLQQLEIDLSNYDFSHTSIRQAFLRNLDLHQVKLNNSHLQDSIFSESIDFIFDVAFNHQGDILASGHQNGDIYLWSIPSGKKILAWKAHNDWFDSLVFSPDGLTIASGTKDEEVKLWSVTTGKLIKTFPAYIMPHSNLVFHPDDEILICATRDRNIQLWNINTGKCYKILQADRERIMSLAISSDGYKLACGYIDGTVEIWNLSTLECNKTIDANTAASFSTISPDGRYIYTGCIDTTVKKWDLETGICLKEFVGHTNQIHGIDLNFQGNMLATADLDNNIRIWDVNTGRCLNVLQDCENTIYAVAFSPNGQILASGGLDYSVRLWSIPSGQPLKSLRGYQSKIWSLAFSPNQQLLASGSRDRQVNLWDGYTGEFLKTIFEGENMSMIWCVAFNPDSSILAACGHDCTIKLWQVDSGKHLKTLEGHIDFVSAIAFSPREKILVSSGYDSTIRIWNWETGDCIKVLNEHTNTVWSVTFSPDGLLLVSSSSDQTIKFWDINTGQCLRTFLDHQAIIMSVCFNAEGTILASGDHDGKIKLWDVETGKYLRTLQPPRLYEEMDITGITGLTISQKDTLKILGAVENN